jgi:UDP-sugar diphosphatase
LFSGFTIELCAGLIDKDKSLEQIVAEEIQEEVGYQVAPQDIRKISSAVAAAGNNGSLSHQYYAQVTAAAAAAAGTAVDS